MLKKLNYKNCWQVLQNKLITNFLRKRFSFLQLILIFALIKVFLIVVFFAIIVPTFPTLENKVKLIQARFISNNSTMEWINDVVAWYDATSEQAFLEDERGDDKKISMWLSSKIRYGKSVNLMQGNFDKQPKFVEKGIANLPSIMFDGIDDFLMSQNFQENILKYKSASFFAVIQHMEFENLSNDLRASNILFSQNIDDKKCNKIFEVSLNNNLKNNDFVLGNIGCMENNFGRFKVKSTPFYLHQKAIIGVIIELDEYSKNKSLNVKLYCNSKLENEFSVEFKNTELLDIFGKNFGRFYVGGKSYNLSQDAKNFRGLIGEIVAFNRAITDFDRRKLEEYFIKKWDFKIKINNNYE